MKRLFSVFTIGVALFAITACTPEAITTELEQQACYPNCGEIPPDAQACYPNCGEIPPPPPPPPTNGDKIGG